MWVHTRTGDEPTCKAPGDAKPWLSTGDVPREQDLTAASPGG